MFGKSATSITDYLISSDTFDPEYCTSLLQKSLKKKADIVVESIEGFQSVCLALEHPLPLWSALCRFLNR
jgi:hypothetical protein